MNQSQAVNVQSLLNELPLSLYQWLIFVLCFLIVLLDGFDTAAIGYIAPSLAKEWGVAKPDLAPVLTAALVGLTMGSLIAGPLADRLGRRVVLIVSVSLFGFACLDSAQAATLQELTWLRLATGLGLGAAMPNAITLMSEYCPDRCRSLLVNTMFCGFPLGAALGGFLAAWIIPQWGWRSVLLLGGAVPLVLGGLLFVWLPESLRYLVARQSPADRIRKLLLRVTGQWMESATFVISEHGAQRGGKGLAMLFSRRYLVGTLALWTAYFMGLVIFYSMINWMPILFKDAGVAAKDATLIAALFPLGGVGAVLFGWLMDRYNGNVVVAVGYALTAVLVFAIGQAVGSVGLLVVAVLAAGAFMNMSQPSLGSLAAGFYPTACRSSGVAWMLGIGRLGGIVGSFMVGELTRRQLGIGSIFAVLALPGAIAAVALLAKQMSHSETPQEHGIASAEAHSHAEEIENA
jgi:MFS transporter, AAHS family, 4-hydroxybenzoate transporter